MRSLIIYAAVAALASCTAAEVSHLDAPEIAVAPNIVVILADDLGYADVSAYGIDRIPTPNIDRIGLEGIRFTDAYASAPVCGPSRAGLQTGRYQERFGFEFNNGPARRDVEENLGLPTDELTMGQALRDAGYATGIVGKWHIGATDEHYPTNRGYDEFVGFLPGATAYIDLNVPGVRNFMPEGATRNSLGRTELTAVIEGPDRKVVDNYQEYLTDYFGQRAAVLCPTGVVHR